MQRISLRHSKISTIYLDPIFINLVESTYSVQFQQKQTKNNQQMAVKNNYFPCQMHGSCLSYQPHRAFSSYIADSGSILGASNRSEPIFSLIAEHFHQPLYTQQDPPLHITPFILISRIPRSGSDSKPAFIQCVQYAKFGAIFGLILPGLTPCITAHSN